MLHSRPAITMLLKSATEFHRPELIAVLFTGTNEDGCDGLATVKAEGDRVIVQYPAIAGSSVMPQAAINAGLADDNVWLDQIWPFLRDMMRENSY